MNVLTDAFAWLVAAENYVGDGAMPVRILEHLWFTAVAVGIDLAALARGPVRNPEAVVEEIVDPVAVEVAGALCASHTCGEGHEKREAANGPLGRLTSI